MSAAIQRQVSRDELIAAGHKPMSPLKALRCAASIAAPISRSEVRLCTAVACPSWPFRMGANPWRRARRLDAQAAKARARSAAQHWTRSRLANPNDRRIGATTASSPLPWYTSHWRERAVAGDRWAVRRAWEAVR